METTDTYHLRDLHANNLLQDIDIKFADLITALAGETACDELALAAALVSNTTAGEKHICLDLEAVADRPLAELFSEIPEKTAQRLQPIRTPDRNAWVARLKASPVAGAPGDYRPLVLDAKNRLYLYRFWAYEQQLARELTARAGANRAPVDPDTLQAGLNRYFPVSGTGTAPDWQKVAVFAATTGNLCIISGGPGTGKTHTVTHILALLLEQDETLRIAICAPTGKAAARIQESIKNSKQTLIGPENLLAKIPDEAMTIHRLLGVRRDSPHFYHDRDNRLSVDVIIVDEASMVSLALMTKLVQAAPRKCRIILLGDKNQLASVEAGAVLGDICAAAEMDRFSKAFCKQYTAISQEPFAPDHAAGNADLADCTVELKFSHRFAEKSAIGALSRAVNRGDAAAAMNLITSDATGTLEKSPLPAMNELENDLAAFLEAGYAGLFRARSAMAAFAVFETFRILCSHRRGAYGVSGINRLSEAILREKGLIVTGGHHYPGRPIMITRNDYHLGLYNGDTGIIWPDETGENRAWFPDRSGGFYTLAPARLPAHDTVYAMTIHKSQGSEFNRILIILPSGAAPIFTRELLYTGITRARRKVTVWAEDDTLKMAVENRMKRHSGLKDSLKAADGHIL